MTSALAGYDLIFPAKPSNIYRPSYKDILLRRGSSDSQHSFGSLDEPLPVYQSSESLAILSEKKAAVPAIISRPSSTACEEKTSLHLGKRINLIARAVISDSLLSEGQNEAGALAAVLRFQLGQFSWAWQHRSTDLLDHCFDICSSGGALQTALPATSKINCFGAILQALLMTIKDDDRRCKLASQYYDMFTSSPEGPRNPTMILLSVCDPVATYVGVKVRNKPEDVTKLPRKLRGGVRSGDLLAISYYSGKRPTYPAPHYCCVSQSTSSKQYDIKVYSLWEDAGGSLTEVTLSHLLFGDYAKADIAVLRPRL